MDETTLKMAMSGFFHDMGKFCGRAVFGISRTEINEHRGDFLPSNDHGGYSHEHALFTAEFIERFKEYLPVQLNKNTWGEGDSFIRLAAAHHKPDSAMEWIITEADRLSNGMDRKDYDEAESEGVNIKDFEKTRLVPILEAIDYDNPKQSLTRDVFKSAYPLEALSHASIFPRSKNLVEPADAAKAKQEYQKLFDGFIEELKHLAHVETIELWFEHFESLMMRYTSAIPSARVKSTIPDVSLYDHLRTTSALSSALYLFHTEQGTLNLDAIKNEQENKFLLISADFSGIQNFIFNGFGDTRKYRSKLLRGRSFYVSLMTELAADMICREIGLPFTSVILNAGGKLTLLAPNTDKAKAAYKKVTSDIEAWLVKRTYGETSIIFSEVTASPADFIHGSFHNLQSEIIEQQTLKKYRRFDLETFGGVVTDYFSDEENEKKICMFCGKRPGRFKKNDKPICALCSDHLMMGEKLVKNNGIAVLLDSSNMLREPLFGRYQIMFSENDLNKEASAGKLIRFWRTEIGEKGKNRFSLKLINGYVPIYSKEDEYDDRLSKSDDEDEKITIDAPKTLNHIAEKALFSLGSGKCAGVDALGVLKADVDNLGLIMACGQSEKYYSVSRAATLSRQMNNFFAVYLPWFLENSDLYMDVYTVFAGGDDLFLIGPWNKMTDLAAELDKSFREYACANNKIHFSAGISVHKSHTPVDKMAEAAENALKESKKHKEKERLTVFDETVTWSELESLNQTTEKFSRWLKEEALSSVMLYKLNKFIEMAAMEKRILTSGLLHINSMDCTKWRALLAYSTERNVGKKLSKEQKAALVKEIHANLADWLNIYGGKLRIPLWTLQYNLRSKR